MGFGEWLSAAAVSFTVSGNTGIAPFCSLFIVGLIEKTNPELLYMDGTIEYILSSWIAIIVLGLLTVLEFLGKCVPVIDEMIDSALTVVIPIFSILGSLSTFGLFTSMPTSSTHTDYNVDMNEMMNNYVVDNDDDGDDDDGRRLSSSSVVSGALIFFQIIVVCVGIILALCLHGIKMIVRLMGEGCLTNCITVLEYIWIGMSITLAIFIREIAICIAILFGIATTYIIKRRYIDKRSVEEIAIESRSTITVVAVPEQSNDDNNTQQVFVKMDEEQQQTAPSQIAPA